MFNFIKNKIQSSNIRATVFFLSISIISLFVMFCSLYPIATYSLFSRVINSIATNFGWLLILISNFILIFVLFLAFSKYGNHIIGGKDAKKDFSNLSWYCMLFAAGMGIGIVFFGVAEPIAHSQFSMPYLVNSSARGNHVNSLVTSFFHWGLHPWGIYAIVGLSLALYYYRTNLPLSFRSILYPVFGDKIHGKIGDIIDVLAVIVCLLGVATSLGFGIKQINTGIGIIFTNFESNILSQIILLLIIFVITFFSVITGLKKGVRYLSNINISLAFLFAFLILLFGPTLVIFQNFVNSLGGYLQNIIGMSFWVESKSGDWQKNWTIFYWAWWISWSPFVGMFIARISKGRSIREFVIAVVIIPPLVSFLWISILGSTALSQIMNLDVLQNALPEESIFFMIGYLTIFADNILFNEFVTKGLSILAIILVIVFFVTSADSATLVIDRLTSGDVNNNKGGGNKSKIFWLVAQFVVGFYLIYNVDSSTGDIASKGATATQSLQSAVIVTALPFSIIILLCCYAVLQFLKQNVSEIIVKK